MYKIRNHSTTSQNRIILAPSLEMYPGSKGSHGDQDTSTPSEREERLGAAKWNKTQDLAGNARQGGPKEAGQRPAGGLVFRPESISEPSDSTSSADQDQSYSAADFEHNFYHVPHSDEVVNTQGNASSIRQEGIKKAGGAKVFSARAGGLAHFTTKRSASGPLDRTRSIDQDQSYQSSEAYFENSFDSASPVNQVGKTQGHAGNPRQGGLKKAGGAKVFGAGGLSHFNTKRSDSGPLDRTRSIDEDQSYQFSEAYLENSFDSASPVKQVGKTQGHAGTPRQGGLKKAGGAKVFGAGGLSHFNTKLSDSGPLDRTRSIDEDQSYQSSEAYLENSFDSASPVKQVGKTQGHAGTPRQGGLKKAGGAKVFGAGGLSHFNTKLSDSAPLDRTRSIDEDQSYQSSEAYFENTFHADTPRPGGPKKAGGAQVFGVGGLSHSNAVPGVKRNDSGSIDRSWNRDNSYDVFDGTPLRKASSADLSQTPSWVSEGPRYASSAIGSENQDEIDLDEMWKVPDYITNDCDEIFHPTAAMNSTELQNDVLDWDGIKEDGMTQAEWKEKDAMQRIGLHSLYYALPKVASYFLPSGKFHPRPPPPFIPSPNLEGQRGWGF